MKNWQQGDVIGRRVAAIPKGARKLDHLVLAHGESGHTHQIKCAVEDAELYETMDLDMYLKCMTTVVLTHEEHGPITLEPGVYKIGRVQEYDYLTGMVNPVQD